VANRKTTILAITSLIAGALLIIYLIKRNELRQTERYRAGDGEFGDPIVDDPSDTGVFKRLDLAEGNTLIIEDAAGKEQAFVCYDNCSPLDENTEAYVGKKVRVYWLATSDDPDPSLDASGTGTAPAPPPTAPERIAVRIELLSQ